MVQNLRLAGVFNKIKGLIIGQFTDIAPDDSMNQTLEEIFLDAVGTHFEAVEIRFLFTFCA